MEEMQAEQTVATQEEIGPGRMLAATREARGVSIDDVAMRMKFAPRQIEALEADQYDQLPGIAIVRGMVRNYARLLEIDPAPLIAELDQRMRTGPITVRPADMHVPIKEGRKEGRMMLILSLVAVIALGAFALDWYVRDHRTIQPAQLEPDATEEAVEQLDDNVRPLEVQPGSNADAAASAAKVSASAAPIVPAAHVVEPEPVAAAMNVTPVIAQEPVAVASQEDDDEVVARSAPASSDKDLQLRFSEEVWVEVKDARDRLLAARLARAGSQLALDGEAPFSLVLGNADAVQVTYKGEPVAIPPTRSGVARLTLE